MLPIVLDPAKSRAGIAGRGDALMRRLRMLALAGIVPGRVHDTAALGALDVLFVAGMNDAESRTFAEAARAAGVLVNVEDVPELCDFHVPASVRRGDLLITVSTGGKAPGLSRAVRAAIERLFGEEWDARTEEIAHLRGRWRWQGLPPNEVSARISAHVARRGWLQ